MTRNPNIRKGTLCRSTAAAALMAGLLWPVSLGASADSDIALGSGSQFPARYVLAITAGAMLVMKDPEDDFDGEDLDDMEDDFEDDFEDDHSGSGGGDDDLEDDLDDELDEDHSGSGGGGDDDLGDDLDDELDEDHSGSGGGGDEDDFEGDPEEDHSGSGGGGEDDEDDDDHSGSGLGSDDDEDDDEDNSGSGSGHDDDSEDKKDDDEDKKDDDDRSGHGGRDDDDDRSGAKSGGDHEDDLAYSEIIDDDGFAAADRELLILVDSAELSRGDLAQAELEIEYALPALDLVMVRLRVGDDDDMFDRLAALEQELGADAVDLNHSYSFDAAPIGSAQLEAQPASLARPLGLAGGGLAGGGLAGESISRLRIGIVDSPIDTAHSALAGAAILARNFASRGRAAGPAHGTMIASILAGLEPGTYRGIAPGAELLAANIFFTKPDGKMVANVESMILALDWLVGEGVSVINMSLSGPPNRLLRRAVERVHGAGVMIVAAVGNAGPAAAPLYPAAYDSVVAVTAIDRGYRVYRRAVHGAHVDFAAPGVNIYAASVSSGYELQSGTSLAVPFVTVALAAMRRGSDQPWPEILAALQARAMDLGADGFDPVFGHGLIRSAGGDNLSGYKPAGEQVQ